MDKNEVDALSKAMKRMAEIREYLEVFEEITRIARIANTNGSVSRQLVYRRIYRLIRSQAFLNNQTLPVLQCLLSICNKVIDQFQTKCPGLEQWTKTHEIISSEKWDEIKLSV